jgi:hypothetical protein
MKLPAQREIVWRVCFRTWDGAWDGGGLPTTFHSKADALAGVARGLATGRYAKAVLTKVRSVRGRETAVGTETFEGTQRAA